MDSYTQGSPVEHPRWQTAYVRHNHLPVRRQLGLEITMTPIYKRSSETERLYTLCQQVLPILQGVSESDCDKLLTDSERTFASCAGLTHKQALALKLAKAQIIASSSPTS